jgi:hypothetical protein
MHGQSHTFYKKWLMAFVLLGCILPAISQTYDDEEEPIQKAFIALGSKPPELGWVLPDGELVTELSANKVTIFSELSEIRPASRVGVIPANSVHEYVKKNQVDCDQIDGENPAPLYRYTAKLSPAKRAPQIFVVSGPSNTGIKAGFEEYKATAAEQSPVWQAMAYQHDQKQHVRSVQQPNGTVFYTFAATYSKDKTLFRKGAFLQDHTGKILGKQIEDVNGQELCDGCAVLTYRDGLQDVYAFQNLISIPTLPYPMVLEDSSTVEGRAIDLFTFSNSGQPTIYRKYEYMVTCILGPDPNKFPL